MKWIGKFVSFFLHGVGISFSVKFLFENVFGILMGTADFSLFNQALFFFIGGFCGVSFIWLTFDFKKEWHRFLVIFINYFLVINLPFGYMAINGTATLNEWKEQNILWISVLFIIYFAIVIYQKILAKQITKKLMKQSLDT